MEVKCSCSGEQDTVLVFSCSGGSNVGQMSNEIAKRLTENDVGSMFCLAGISGRVSGIVETSRAATTRVVIDGCSLSCARKTMEEAGLDTDLHVILTEHGMKKLPGFDIPGDDLERLTDHITDLIAKK